MDLGMWVAKSRLLEMEYVKDVALGVIKRTFYDHFCAGEDAVEAGKSVLRLREYGLRGMLDYALEFVDDNQACDRNLTEFLRTVESAKSLPPSSVSC